MRRGRDALIHQGGVAVAFTEGDQFERVGHFGLQRLHALDLVGELSALPHERLGGRCVVPKIGIFGAVVQFG